jgi:plasmid stabilization system protein ParE
MKLVVAPGATAQIMARKRWWRANRPEAPERFDDELAAALVKIAERPDSFPVFSARGERTVRRCLLKRTRCHLYFEVILSANEVWIVAARGAVQRPKTRFPSG